jgi:hypothetical protein
VRAVVVAVLAAIAGVFTWAVVPGNSFPACLDGVNWVVTVNGNMFFDLGGDPSDETGESTVLRGPDGFKCRVTDDELDAFLDANDHEAWPGALSKEVKGVEESPPGDTPIEPSNVKVFTEGVCLDNRVSTEPPALPSVPCEAPHTSEKYATFDVRGTSFPPQGSVYTLIAETCNDLFDVYTGISIEDAVGRFGVVFGAGGRPSNPVIQEVECSLYGPQGTLTTLTGSARKIE